MSTSELDVISYRPLTNHGIQVQSSSTDGFYCRVALVGHSNPPALNRAPRIVAHAGTESVRYLLSVRPDGRHPLYVPSDLARELVHAMPPQQFGEGAPSILHLPTSLKELRLPAFGTKPSTDQFTRHRVNAFPDER
jgi:hypothetical protein